MKKLSLVIAVIAIITLTAICFMACTKIPNDPNDAKQKFEDNGCTVDLHTDEFYLDSIEASLESRGCILIGNITAYMTITLNGESAKILYFEYGNDAETAYDFYVTQEAPQESYLDTDKIFIGTKALYEILKKK